MPSGLAALLDDIATITKLAAASVDDIGAAAGKASAKAAGVVIDDTAVTPRYVTGFTPARELPIIWKIAKGSLKNKVILVPAALLISAFAPWLITPLLMLGGAFLCFEGVEKVLSLFHKPKQAHDALRDSQQAEQMGVAPSSVKAASEKNMDPVAYEKAKVAGAVRTDFILSAEIIAIALGTVASKPLWEQFAVLVAVALAITVFVYGLVAGIVRMDDVGNWLLAKSSSVAKAFGRGLIAFTPWLMRGLSIVGTAAMFMVGGSLLVHGIKPIEHWVHEVITPMGGIAAAVGPVLVHVAVGAVIGGAVVLCVELWHKLRPSKAAH